MRMSKAKRVPCFLQELHIKSILFKQLNFYLQIVSIKTISKKIHFTLLS